MEQEPIAKRDYVVDTIKLENGQRLHWGNEGGAHAIYAISSSGVKKIFALGSQEEISAKWRKLKDHMSRVQKMMEGSPLGQAAWKKEMTAKGAVEFRRDRHGGGTVDRIVAYDKDGKVVGGFNRKGVAEDKLPGSLSKSDYAPGARKKHENTNCTTCHGRKVMYRTSDKKLHADKKKDSKAIKCPACHGTGERPDVKEEKRFLSKPRSIQEGLTWSALGDGMSPADKMAVFEEYYTNGSLTESVNEEFKEYIESLIDFSVDPQPGQKYIVVPLLLAGNRFMVTDPPSVLKFVSQDDRLMEFVTDNYKVKFYPSNEVTDRIIFRTFVFDTDLAYNRFRTALSVKFYGKGLPDLSLDKDLATEEKQKGVDGKACWKGYKRMGTKMKDGRRVDNCVPVKEGKDIVKSEEVGGFKVYLVDTGFGYQVRTYDRDGKFYESGLSKNTLHKGFAAFDDYVEQLKKQMNIKTEAAELDRKLKGLEDSSVQRAIIDAVERLFRKNEIGDYDSLEAVRQGVKHHFSKPGATVETAVNGILNILNNRMSNSGNYVNLSRFKEALRQSISHHLKKQGLAESQQTRKINMKKETQINEYQTLAGWQAAARKSGAQLVEGTRAVKEGILVGIWDGKTGQLLEGIEDKLAAAREKAAAKGRMIKDKEDEKSAVRKVAGAAYGGSRARDEEEADEEEKPAKASSGADAPKRRGRPPGSGKKAAPPAAPKRRGRPRKISESVDMSVEDFFQKVATSADGVGMLYDAQGGDYGGEVADAVQRLYDQVSINSRLHPDDDFEEILNAMLDDIESDYAPTNESALNEKAVSRAQQRAAGIALAARRSGEKPKAGTASAEMAKMSTKELKKFAGTKHEDLPKKKVNESKEQKPDFLDLDKDGNKEEPMKKAAHDAEKEKTDESIDQIKYLAGLANAHRSADTLMTKYAVNEGVFDTIKGIFKSDKKDAAPVKPAEKPALNMFGGRKQAIDRAAGFTEDEEMEEVKEDVNMSLNVNGEDDVVKMVQKLAGMPVAVVTGHEEPESSGCALADMMGEMTEEYDNSPDEKVYGVDSAIPTGDDLASKGRESPKVNGGGNPMTMESIWKRYQDILESTKDEKAE